MHEPPLFNLTRADILGRKSFYQFSDLGVCQFPNYYDKGLLNHILRKALAIKDNIAQKRQLNLKYVRAAHLHIPEINELIFDRERLDHLSELAGTDIEPYPISVISSTITYSGPEVGDGALGWHCDGVPATELVVLAMDDLDGGELEIYQGCADEGLAADAEGRPMRNEDIIRLRHKCHHSIFGQFIRVMHRIAPIHEGTRVTLNLNVRGVEKPYIDDNSLYYLAADNPDFEWLEEYIGDVKCRQLPSYLRAASY